MEIYTKTQDPLNPQDFSQGVANSLGSKFMQFIFGTRKRFILSSVVAFIICVVIILGTISLPKTKEITTTKQNGSGFSTLEISPTQNPTITINQTPTPPITKIITSTTPTNISPQTDSFTVKVLIVGFNPVQDNRNLAQTYFTMEGKSPDQFEDHIFGQSITAFNQLSNNSIHYEISQKMSVAQFPSYTNGFQYTIDEFQKCRNGIPLSNGLTCEQQKWLFDHVSWVRDNKICETADAAGVDEIWMMSSPYIATYEVFMIGPNQGFYVNGPSYTIPECKKHYIVINASYEVSGSIMHIYGHRVEATMDYLTANWKDEDKHQYWENFATISRYGNPESGYSDAGCGNAHFPLNANRQYDYSNTAVKVFNCPDWKNFPSLKGETESINCNAWGCTDPGWGKHWLGSIPRSDGEVQMISKTGSNFTFKRNWWHYLLYPENAIGFRNTQ